MSETKLENLKRHLNEMYGRDLYSRAICELKTPVYIDNRKNKDIMEEKFMIEVEDTFDMDWGKLIDQQTIYRAINSLKGEEQKPEDTTTENETWTWVTGYKGLDKDMKAHGDFQYEMDHLYIMPDGEPVKTCKGGYHLCLNLEDLFGYKSIESGNRFFECSALVRESDLAKYGTREINGYWASKIDKLAAKSIRLIRELTVDEILAHIEGANEWPQHVKEMAIAKNINAAKIELKILDMVRMGYARPLAEYIINNASGSEGYNLAVALDAQPGISMDTKINAIFSHI